MTHELLKLSVIICVMFSIGMFAAVCMLYLRNHREGKSGRFPHILPLSLGYFCLLACTAISIFREKYPVADYWNYLAVSAYVLSIAGFALVFREQKEKRLRK